MRTLLLAILSGQLLVSVVLLRVIMTEQQILATTPLAGLARHASQAEIMPIPLRTMTAIAIPAAAPVLVFASLEAAR
jgi:hypothetical protein